MAKLQNFIEITFESAGESYTDVFIILVDTPFGEIPHINEDEIKSKADRLCKLRYGSSVVMKESKRFTLIT